MPQLARSKLSLRYLACEHRLLLQDFRLAACDPRAFCPHLARHVGPFPLQLPHRRLLRLQCHLRMVLLRAALSLVRP